MVLALDFPPISHLIRWPTIFGSGVFDTSRRAMHASPLGASKVVNWANGAVRLLKVYNPRR